MTLPATVTMQPRADQAGDSRPAFDVERIRADFPILKQTVHGKPLIYFDNGATTQKPQSVLDAIDHYYRIENANVHRGAHRLSELATDAYEDARVRVQKFLGAHCLREIIFTRGATEAINLVASSYGRSHVQAGDEIIITWMEHHSNIVPWQHLCQERGAICAWCRSPTAASCASMSWKRCCRREPRWSPWSMYPTPWAPSIRCAGLLSWLIAAACPCSSMALRRCRTSASTSRIWIAISTSSPGTKIYGPTGIGVLVRQGAASGTDAPLSGGWRHDSHGQLREDDL